MRRSPIIIATGKHIDGETFETCVKDSTWLAAGEITAAAKINFGAQEHCHISIPHYSCAQC